MSNQDGKSNTIRIPKNHSPNAQNHTPRRNSGKPTATRKDSTSTPRETRRGSFSKPIKTIRRDSNPECRVVLEDFELNKILGTGAYGQVYLAKHKGKNRWMALKEMEKKKIKQDKKEVQIRNEKKVLMTRKSPYLIKMHFSFQTKERLYLAMEYCPGGDLRKFLEVLERLEENVAQLFLAEMIMAVSALHKMGFIHRDLKPDNFLIDSRGHLKLADFGLSKQSKTYVNPSKMTEDLKKKKIGSSLLNGEKLNVQEALNKGNIDQRFRRTFTQRNTFDFDRQNSKRQFNPPCLLPSGSISQRPQVSMRKELAYSVVGSPNYMSPEVTAPHGQGYGEEVDWWSLGCVFFEMLLGFPVFQGDAVEEVFAQIQNWKCVIPNLMEQYRDEVSPDAFSLLKGFLCDPGERYGKDIHKLKCHPFFKGLDWNHLYDIVPEFIPTDEYAEHNDKLNAEMQQQK